LAIDYAMLDHVSFSYKKFIHYHDIFTTPLL